MSHLDKLLAVFRDQRLVLPTSVEAEGFADLLELYLVEWNQWNGKINLTSETVAGAVIEKHIFDSLQYARAVDNPQCNVMDIGSGAGFPGIPLKVIFPGVFMTLVESQRKRANFLRNCVRNMRLENVQVINGRAEELDVIHQDRFDLILFRGVGEVSYCLQLAEPFLKIGGRVAFKKDPQVKTFHEMKIRDCLMTLTSETSLMGWTGIESKLVLYCKHSP